MVKAKTTTKSGTKSAAVAAKEASPKSQGRKKGSAKKTKEVAEKKREVLAAGHAKLGSAMNKLMGMKALGETLEVWQYTDKGFSLFWGLFRNLLLATILDCGGVGS